MADRFGWSINQIEETEEKYLELYYGFIQEEEKQEIISSRRKKQQENMFE